MFRSWLPWLLLLVFLLAGGEALSWMLREQDASTAGSIVALVGRLLAAAWLVVGMVRWRQVPWVAKTARLAGATILTIVVVSFLQVMQLDRLARWAVSIYLMSVLFFGAVLLLGFLMSFNARVLAIAKTTVDEALKSKMALSFIVALFILLPSIQLFAVATETRVEYQVKSFLVFSLLVTGTLLGFLTILQGAWTTSQEREGKQVFLTLTKPVGRLQYLLGKWLGLVLLNAALVSVASVGIYRFTMELKLTDEYFDEVDQAAVDQRVLTARTKVDPLPNNAQRSLQPMVLAAARRVLADNDLDSIDDIPKRQKQSIIEDERKRWLSIDGLNQADGAPSYKEFLFTDIPPLWNPLPVRGAIQRHFNAPDAVGKTKAIESMREGLALAPEPDARQRALDLVEQLDQGRPVHDALDQHLRQNMPAGEIQLQLKPRGGGELEAGRVRMIVSANGVLVPPPHYDPKNFAANDPEAQRRNNSWSLADNTFSVINIPANYVNEARELVLRIDNVTITGASISFHKDRGLVMLYRSGGFTPNFAKAVVLLWIRLMFLAMVAVAAGSFLTFPVAGLLAFVVFFGAIGANYLNESLLYYSAINTEYESLTARFVHAIESTAGTIVEGEYYETIKIVISAIAQLWLFVMPDLSSATGTNMIRDGVKIPWSTIFSAILRVVLISSTICCVLGWYVFRRRELARVIV